MGIGDLTRPAVFLDRDGVINALVLNPETGRMESPLMPDAVQVLPGVPPALFRLQSAGYSLVLVSNQPNYALGKCTLDTLGVIHNRLAAELIRDQIHFTRVCYCLHHPKGVLPGYSGLCVCRKPSPWFLLRARDDFGLSLAESWMIGDQPTDIQCGKSAGTRTIRVGSVPGISGHKGSPAADYAVGSMVEAVEVILGQPIR
jgi:D-glycero-D-manno-heptose 1,7-bisphosphate phosphatase